MANSFFDTSNDPFVALSQDMSAQRTQVAKYSIIRAATYMQNNDNASALKEFKKALAFDSQNLTAQTYIGKLNLSMGNNYEAIKAFKTMVKWQPSSSDAHINLANAYLQDKQYANSESEFKAAARLDPANPLPDYTLGLQYSNTDRLADAESQFLKVQKISPRDGNVYYALGMVYNKQGKYEDAVKNLEKAITLKGNFAAANYELGVAYDALGRAEDAQAQLTILKSSGSIQAQDLQNVLAKPAMVSMTADKSSSLFSILGPGTPLWMLDPTLLAKPDASKTLSVTITFNSDMDAESITNTQNWSISKGNSTEAGYYNNSMPQGAKDAAIPVAPLSVVYNAFTQEATISFRLKQNSAGNATIDPKHIVFKFNGKDANGKDMDITADQINGYSLTPF